MTVTVVYVLLLVAAGWAGARLRARRRGFPFATAVAFVLVAVPSLLQLTVAPGLFEALRRDRAAIGDGEIWRLLTSFVVQDSGWTGTIFNLLTLAVIGTFAERLWGTARWLLLATIVQILGGLWGLIVLPVGAGASLVDFGLAASLAMASLLKPRSAPAPPPLKSRSAPTPPPLKTRSATAAALLEDGRWVAAIALVCALVLLVRGDIHGGAATIGALVATALVRSRREG